MPSQEEEINLDIEEFNKLLEIATRPSVKALLANEAERLKKLRNQQISSDSSMHQEGSSEFETGKESKSRSSPVSSDGYPDQSTIAGTKTIAPPTKHYKDITNYAWDQSEKFMKIYVTINGVDKVKKEDLTIEYKNKSFRLRAENVGELNYQCHVAHLWGDVVPNDSYHKVKKDMVLLMLKKKEEKKTWAYVTEREDQKKKTPKSDEKKDPNEGLMDLLKKMYDDGDDEMKRTIAKSFTESRNKKENSEIAEDF